VYWDGTGLCLFTKRLEHGVFLWPSNVEPGGTLMLTSAQLSMLIDGVDWRSLGGGSLIQRRFRQQAESSRDEPVATQKDYRKRNRVNKSWVADWS
jgi:hypothetical protein